MHKHKRNHNYQINTNRLDDGRVRAKAQGRKTTQRTYPAGTSLEQAALELAKLIEGERAAEVRILIEGTTWCDYAVYVK